MPTRHHMTTVATTSSRPNPETLSVHYGCYYADWYDDMKFANGTTMRRRRSWSTTSSIPTCDYLGSSLQLLFRCTMRLVVTIYDLLLASFLGWHCRSSANVAYPFSYSGTRAILHGSWSRSWAIVICDGYKGWSGLRHVIEKISSYSLSVMYATCLY
jgi:hypothetical protein